jgi:hypothetical protein
MMETIQKLYGVPKIIVSERDPISTRKIWIELFSCFHTQLDHKSSYHPQSDDKSQNSNECIEGYLCFFAFDKHTQWVRCFHLEQWWYNTSFHTS